MARRARIANKAEIATLFEVELTTVDRWIRKGCPVVQNGSRGVAWELDIIDVARWKFAPPDGAFELDPAKMATATERKAYYEGELKRRELDVIDRRLIKADELEPALLEALATLSQSAQSIGDTLERRHGVSSEIAEIVEGTIFEYLDEVATKLSKFGTPREAKKLKSKRTRAKAKKATKK